MTSEGKRSIPLVHESLGKNGVHTNCFYIFVNKLCVSLRLALELIFMHSIRNNCTTLEGDLYATTKARNLFNLVKSVKEKRHLRLFQKKRFSTLATINRTKS